MSASYFFLTSPIFRDEPTFADLSWLWAAITIVLIICTPMWPTYSESWVRALSDGTTPEKIFFTKMSRRGDFSKKRRFRSFSVSPPPQQSQKIVTRTILMPDDFHMAHLNRYGPSLNDNIKNVAFLIFFGLPTPSEVSLSRIVSPKKAVFRAFFFRKSCFWPISSQWRPPSVIHGWKAVGLLFLMVERKNIFFSSCRACDFLWRSGQIFSFILRSCHIL